MSSRHLYFVLKPFLPWHVRIALRRIDAGRKRKASKAIWPIHEAASHPPAGWRGWPDGKKFAFVLTHDVEGPEGLAKCRELAELDRSLGFRSSFNFIPKGSYSTPPALREWLFQEGFEVGIHDLRHNGGLYHSRRAFQKDAREINRYVKEWGVAGFRSGFMLHELDWIHDLNVEYDASTFDTDPFEPQPDAAGIIFPFWVSASEDPANPKGYVELPYTLPQDSTMFLILREISNDIWLNKLDWLAGKGAMALINVHPDYVQFHGEPASSKKFSVDHYIGLLQHVRDKYRGEYWQPLPREAARYISAIRPAHRPRRIKRVCLVTYSFYERDARVFRYGEALAARGDEVEVLCLRSSASLPREEMINGCRVIRLQHRPINEKSPSVYLGRLVKFLWQCSQWIRRNHSRRSYDLLHVHNVPDFLVFSGWRPKLGGAKIILDIHDIVPELFASKFAMSKARFTLGMLKWMEKASAVFANHVILANHLWMDLYTRRSARPAKVSVLINYVDSQLFSARARIRQDERKIVIFPGSLQTHQGLDVAIRAFPNVVAAVPAAELHIYGDGPAKQDLIALAAELGLNGHVKFFDFLPTKQIADIMAEADLGVVPKRADSFGNEAFSTKILEFMSLGIPVVASSTKIDRYYFDDSVLRFFESGNSEALAKEIIQLLHNPEACRTMAARAIEHARNNSWEQRKVDYLDLVDKLCSVSN